jgi:hypothetical protein
MFRFTIRDVLWLTVVVGLGVALWAERRELNQLRLECELLRSERDHFRASEAKYLTALLPYLDARQPLPADSRPRAKPSP